jgi:integrase
MAKQLYSFIPDIRYPEVTRVDHQTGEVLLHEDVQPGCFSFVWPNGFPCSLIEMFLQKKSKEVKISKKDGGTIGNYASTLSHLVRHCFNKKIEFWDLVHSDIDEFILSLVNERDSYNERKRDNNTVKLIIANSISFLDWLQINIVTDRNIVGVNKEDKRYQIRLKRDAFRTDGGKVINYTLFPSSLPDSTKTEKSPMPTVIKNKLWDTLSKSKSDSKCSNKLKGKFTKKEQKEHLEYMHARREVQLILLDATGLRPQELITIKVSVNLKLLQKNQIKIPTLKRREARSKVRVIPIDRAVAIKLEIFINKHRKLLIRRLINTGIISSVHDVDDVIYLNSETGKEVSPDAAYVEFRRLSLKAGISQKSCQSMFRHRFITNMVKLHLIGFRDNNKLKTKHMMTESDYRTILKKVASFTGHKEPNSLMHYIDLAWDELDVFSYTYEVKELQDRLKAVSYSISSIKSNLYQLINNPSKHELEQLIKELTLIEKTATEPNITITISNDVPRENGP